MKKLTIAAAIVCAAAMANAGQYLWGLQSMMYSDHTGAELTTGTAFLFVGEDWVTATDSAFVYGKAQSVGDPSGFDWNQYGYGKLDQSKLQSSDLITKTSGDKFSIILVEGNVTSLADYEGYYAIVNGTSEEGVIPGTTPVLYANMIDAGTPVQTSSYMSVPEPTSGLLLLLGVAGLALRRRRA